MTLAQLRYTIEIAKAGSMNEAAKSLYISQPSLSTAIRELEAETGVEIFRRTNRGIAVTPAGEEFLGYARKILKQIDEVESIYRHGRSGKQRFSISVPRACYISDAFARFTKKIGGGSMELFYKETNSMRAINNILHSDYKLGIIRYASNYDKYFKNMLDEKELAYEMITEFQYVLVMSAKHPLAGVEQVKMVDLEPYTEIAHADPYVPSLSFAAVKKEELPDNIQRRIFVFERASQFELLRTNTDTFMWMSPVPSTLLDCYRLVEKRCDENKKMYKDLLIYRKDYKLSQLDELFITELCSSKRKYI
mgnify:CR=1 FL=1